LAAHRPATGGYSARDSVLYLTSSAAFLLAAGAGGALLKDGIVKLWPCALYRLTGFYCLTCGATRAADALMHLHVAQSLFYNPLPVLSVLAALTVMCAEGTGLVRRRRIGVEWLPWSVTTVVVILFLFCLARNFGLIGKI